MQADSGQGAGVHARSLREAFVQARRRLAAGGIDDPELEAEVLLRHALALTGDQVTRSAFFSRFEEALSPPVAQRFDSFLVRRLAREPSAYITGRREFYGLDFLVTPDVLVPRPETEALVELAIATGRSHAGRRFSVADAGTGSGAIAVALAASLPHAEVYATDLSERALAVARRNAERHLVDRRISFLHGDLLLPLASHVDLIAANLPYVSTGDWHALPPELHDYEPRLALDGGSAGLDLIASLLHQAPRYLRRPGAVLLEFGDGQSEAVLALAQAALPGAEVRIANDLGGRPRVLVATL